MAEFKLSRDQIADLQRVFNVVAIDYQNEYYEKTILPSQLRELFAMLGIQPDTDELAGLLADNSLEHADELGFEDFQRIMTDYFLRTDKDEEIMEAFQALRTSESDDPIITSKSILDLFSSMGEENITLEECDRIIQLLGENGSLTWDKFYEHMYGSSYDHK
uniref:EF-hand domain-containing protein n=1 Tax=Mucochytrium quahogii TaxID=96639 RepID=A0A7S2RNY1_9STRA|mmetsp:Transcript_29804/g.47451  ORF Transcript_29804/g.47451 Transcript_29804/m.47451 type:complete len:162 (+) Transcript_29804:222-707(+)